MKQKYIYIYICTCIYVWESRSTSRYVRAAVMIPGVGRLARPARRWPGDPQVMLARLAHP